jgi:hypothetical protein
LLFTKEDKNITSDEGALLKTVNYYNTSENKKEKGKDRNTAKRHLILSVDDVGRLISCIVLVVVDVGVCIIAQWTTTVENHK